MKSARRTALLLLAVAVVLLLVFAPRREVIDELSPQVAVAAPIDSARAPAAASLTPPVSTPTRSIASLAPAPSSSIERAVAARTRRPPPEPDTTLPTDGLIVDSKIVPTRAMDLLMNAFDELHAELRQQAAIDPDATQITHLYSEQITSILADSGVSLARIACGDQICAAELSRANGPDALDPFSDPAYIETLLPRDARVETVFLDPQRRVLRRFLFSIDPRVNSIEYRPRRPTG